MPSAQGRTNDIKENAVRINVLIDTLENCCAVLADELDKLKE